MARKNHLYDRRNSYKARGARRIREFRQSREQRPSPNFSNHKIYATLSWPLDEILAPKRFQTAEQPTAEEKRPTLTDLLQVPERYQYEVTTKPNRYKTIAKRDPSYKNSY